MIAHPLNIDIPPSQLAESPYWDVSTETLYWVDIKGKIIHNYNPITGITKTCHAPKMAVFILRTQDGGLVVGLEDGIYKLDFQQEIFEPIALISDKNVRLNDGKCDPSGRIWFGTMVLNEQSDKKIAKLYCLTDKIVEMDKGFVIANGKAWSDKIANNQFFYHVDTTAKIIWRYLYNADNGNIGDKENFIQTQKSPDGMCIDAQGNLYVAMYDGNCVDVYSPEGKRQYSIKVPAHEVTSCAFGGLDLKTLYITTAKEGLLKIELDISGVIECPASMPAKIDKDLNRPPPAHSS